MKKYILIFFLIKFTPWLMRLHISFSPWFEFSFSGIQFLSPDFQLFYFDRSIFYPARSCRG